MTNMASARRGCMRVNHFFEEGGSGKGRYSKSLAFVMDVQPFFASNKKQFFLPLAKGGREGFGSSVGI